MRVLLIALLVIPLVRTAQARPTMGRESGGGDICEERFKTVSSDIEKWIRQGGAQYLKLPSGWNESTYAKAMLSAIHSTKVSCVNQKDKDYPVQVNGTPKVCKFDRGLKLNRVTCDFTKFQSVTESKQYVLVHHELAGIAGIEVPNGDDSDYQTSSQITDYLEDQKVKRLAVKAPLDVKSRTEYYCVSTSGNDKSLFISVGTDVQIDQWGDRDLIGSMFVDLGYSDISPPWRPMGCANNICTSFLFDSQNKSLSVDLYENDEMQSFYTQTYKCE